MAVRSALRAGRALPRGRFLVLISPRVAAPVYKTEITTIGSRRADCMISIYPQNISTNFVDKWQPFGKYSSLVNYNVHGVHFS
jgi:hypothetical protein